MFGWKISAVLLQMNKLGVEIMWSDLLEVTQRMVTLL